MNQTQQNLNQTIQSQFGQSQKTIADITERLTKLDETNKQVVSFTDQLQSLQDILKKSQTTAAFWVNIFWRPCSKMFYPPDLTNASYPFKDGTIVDAVVFVKDKIIPIDSKFSLENYNRVVEEREGPERDRLEKAFVNDLKLRITETGQIYSARAGDNEISRLCLFRTKRFITIC